MIFFTGVHLASVGLQENRHSLPFFTNTLSPFSANGMRLLITSPGVQPSIDNQGIDISPGQSTLIALTGKETTRLPWPYSECTNTDYELSRLRQSVVQKLGYTPESSIADNQSTYTQQDCRSACVQQYIWQECHCLDLESRLPFENMEGNLMCGALAKSEMHMFLEEAKFNRKRCVMSVEELASGKCSFLHKLINDIACAHRAKRKYTNQKALGQVTCNCPPACHTYDYDVSISVTPWPADGFEMESAYETLVIAHPLEYNFEPNKTISMDCGQGGQGYEGNQESPGVNQEGSNVNNGSEGSLPESGNSGYRSKRSPSGSGIGEDGSGGSPSGSGVSGDGSGGSKSGSGNSGDGSGGFPSGSGSGEDGSGGSSSASGNSGDGSEGSLLESGNGQDGSGWSPSGFGKNGDGSEGTESASGQNSTMETLQSGSGEMSSGKEDSNESDADPANDIKLRFV